MTDLATIKTVDDVKRLFADTIFWNWLYPVDRGLADPAHAETEYPLTVLPLPPAYRQPCDDEGSDGDVLLRFEHGELSMDVARVFVDEDSDETACRADATYIAALPVTQPILFREIAKLAAFKAYVHKRLDDAGVPADPDSPHKAEGCRIGARLDWLLGLCNAAMARLAEHNAAAAAGAGMPPGPHVGGVLAACQVLATIADRYDENRLDDEARKFWGLNDEHVNPRRPEDVILYTGRGGGTLLTLADCLAAREALKGGTR